MKHERVRPSGERTQPLLLLALLGDRFEEVHVGLVGGEAVERDGSERRVPGRLEDDRLCPMIEPEATPLAANMWAEQSRLSPEPDQLAAQFLGRSVSALPLVVLIRQDLLPHETFGAELQLGEFVG